MNSKELKIEIKFTFEYISEYSNDEIYLFLKFLLEYIYTLCHANF